MSDRPAVCTSTEILDDSTVWIPAWQPDPTVVQSIPVCQGMRTFLDTTEPVTKAMDVVDGMLQSGGTSLLVGRPVVGKSVMAANLAACVARGTEFLGRKVRIGPVIMLSLEGVRRELQKSLLSLGVTPDDRRLRVQFGWFQGLNMEWLAREIRLLGPVLVIIDVFEKFTRIPDINDYAPVSMAMTDLTRLASETNCHIQLTHHANSRAGLSGDNVLGSTALWAGVDTLLLIDRKPNGQRILTTSQRYGVNMPPTVIAMDPQTFRIHAAGSPSEPEQDDIGAQILDYLKSVSEPTSEDDIMRHVTGDLRNKRKGLRQLVSAGAVSRTGEGRKGSPYLYAIKSVETT